MTRAQESMMEKRVRKAAQRVLDVFGGSWTDTSWEAQAGALRDLRDALAKSQVDRCPTCGVDPRYPCWVGGRHRCPQCGSHDRTHRKKFIPFGAAGLVPVSTVEYDCPNPWHEETP